MVMLASNGTIILANAQIEQIFGYTRRELLGKPVEMLMPERFRERHPHFREAFFRNPQPRPMARGMELFGQRKDGTEIPVEIAKLWGRSGRRFQIFAWSTRCCSVRATRWFTALKRGDTTRLRRCSARGLRTRKL